MKLRTYTFMGLCALTGLSAAAGYSAEMLTLAAEQYAQDGKVQQDCMAQGFDTADGRVGCFTPVIAVIDETFFAAEDIIVIDDAAE